MQTTLLDQIIIENNQVYYQTLLGEKHDLPHLTNFLKIYKETDDQLVKERIFDILNHDLGTLLIVEIMIDPTHETTLARLKSGEISKNMKHVGDYYLIPISHYALAKDHFEAQNKGTAFESCHFSQFPYGLVIMREGFQDYKNAYTAHQDLINVLNA